jgi:NAD(P)-dependent dehydrogenase (short-subunit alcohol dehydrogenase family)
MSQSAFLVVGGTSGIGLEITRQLASQGGEVHVVSRNGDAVEGMSGVRHYMLDVANDSFPGDILPDRLSGMVYCPGSIRLRPFNRLSEAEFKEDLAINFFGAVKTIQAAVVPLRKNRPGSAIVLFSTVAVQSGMPFHASIASAKGAVEGLTRSLAAELAPKIRVNAVAPSLTDTPLAAPLVSSDDRRSAAAQRHPLKRIGSPREIAAMACFLLSDEASWISGQVLSVDGGMGALRVFR